MHDSSLNHRESAYRIILLAIRHIPDLLENPDALDLIDSLEKNWEPLPFIDPSPDRLTNLSIQLAFWLAKIPILQEITTGLKDEVLLGNALNCLSELEAVEVQHDHNTDRALYFTMRQALKDNDFPTFDKAAKKVKKTKETDALIVWRALLQKKTNLAEEIFKKYDVTQENSPLHFPYGAWAYMTQGVDAAMKHFSFALETPHPTTAALPSHFLMGRIDENQGWIERAFYWEKKELHRQIELFYRCVGHEKT
jgi:serine/threonine-protein kinase